MQQKNLMYFILDTRLLKLTKAYSRKKQSLLIILIYTLKILELIKERLILSTQLDLDLIKTWYKGSQSSVSKLFNTIKPEWEVKFLLIKEDGGITHM